jgi:hypothetical protein
MAAGLSAEAQAMPAGIPIVDLGASTATTRRPRRRCREDRRGVRRDRLLLCREPQRAGRGDRSAPCGGRQFFSQPVSDRLKVKADKNNRGYREVGDVVHANGKLSAATASISASR